MVNRTEILLYQQVFLMTMFSWFKRKIVITAIIAAAAFNIVKAQSEHHFVNVSPATLAEIKKPVDLTLAIDKEKKIDITDSVHIIVNTITKQAVKHAKEEKYKEMDLAVSTLEKFCKTIKKESEEGKKQFKNAARKVILQLWRVAKINIRKSKIKEAKAAYEKGLEICGRSENQHWKNRFENILGPGIEENIKIGMAKQQP